MASLVMFFQALIEGHGSFDMLSQEFFTNHDALKCGFMNPKSSCLNNISLQNDNHSYEAAKNKEGEHSWKIAEFAIWP
ncbi:hypothetical protein AMTR_s00010p00249870 [Amborella trichopoda]|uniref:Uncharacterized protein n=1 Tax=Amborella trichopoda TaxID=13333 RepID=W1NF01_AMBTC|nr:hypothetical protein AMTR_s00010p00249870 [Amborella trichopoda]